MYNFKKALTLVVILILTGCTTKNINLSPLLSANNYLLIATSYDSTIEGARSKAVSMLAQNIYVQVKSDFSSNEKLDSNGEFISNVSNQINLNSSGFFKDLEYSNTEYLGKNNYKISVGLTSSALVNTINYLNNGLKISLIDNLTKSDLKDEFNKTSFLISLIMFANTKSISLHNIDLTKITKYKDNLALRLSNVSQVIFNVLPNLNNISKININNKDYTATEAIFLPPGLYYYTVYAKGYKTVTNKIELPASDKIFVSLYLQKLLVSPFKVKLDITSDSTNINTSLLKNQVSSLLEKYQLNVNNFTNNVLHIHFLPTNYNIINDYYYFNLPVDISLIKNTQNITKTFTITYVSNKANGNVSANIIIKKIDEFLEELTADNNLSTVYK